MSNSPAPNGPVVALTSAFHAGCPDVAIVSYVEIYLYGFDACYDKACDLLETAQCDVWFYENGLLDDGEAELVLAPLGAFQTIESAALPTPVDQPRDHGSNA